GAPKVAAGIFTESCFLGVLNWQWPCLLHPPKVHQLLQNFPGAYELAPSRAYFEVWPEGYLHRSWDANGDGRVDGPLDEMASLAALASHNPRLAQEADTLHALLDGWR